ncbi:heme A synthase [Thiosulfatihalobacter marinus]|uniref:heme A synthase n=1 Tax=Thiosulfatihalobacter marinus TaxID=2792481 RepID=UPI0018D8D50C|nr:heme A synthase [Thiosulfatihalobacter marinus]
MSRKRSIFEEVGEDGPGDVPDSVGMIDKGVRGARRGIRAWLMVLFAMVVVMIAVGGLTRLTESGLSITEWRPVTGAIPPMNAADWQAEFDKYKEIDQWRIENQWMTLADFQYIYWWEWGHRQLGRIVGLVWALGFAGFMIARQVPAGWSGRLLLIGALGGVQGAVGWWMVASGVTSGEDMTSVASYRLAVHLGLAFVILGFIGWYILTLGRTERDLMQARRGREAKLFSMSTGLLHVAFVQVLLGALVAGIDAGRSYTDWPLMGGQVFVPDAFILEPVWKNFFENPGLVQFVHRVWGYLFAIFAVVVWRRARGSANATTRLGFNAVLAAVAVQVGIGIVTVIYAAPVQIAIVHQVMAVLVWALILRARFLAYYPKSSMIREG